MLIVFLALIGSILAGDPAYRHDGVVDDEAIASSPYPVARSRHNPNQVYGILRQSPFDDDDGIRQPLPYSRDRLQPNSRPTLPASDSSFEIVKPSDLQTSSLRPRTRQGHSIRSFSNKFNALLSKYRQKNLRNSPDATNVVGRGDGHAYRESYPASKDDGETQGHRARRQAMFVINAADYRDADEYDDDKEHTTQLPLVDVSSSSPRKDEQEVKLGTVEPRSEKTNRVSRQRPVPSEPIDDFNEDEPSEDGKKSSNDEERSGATIERRNSFPDKSKADGRMSVRKNNDESSDEAAAKATQELLWRRGIVYGAENVLPSKEVMAMLDDMENQLNELIDELLADEMTPYSYEELVRASSDLAELKKHRSRLQTRRENLIRELQVNVYTPATTREERTSEEIVGDVIVDEFMREKGIKPADEIDIVEEMVAYVDKQIEQVSSKKVISSKPGFKDISSYVAEMKRFRSKLLKRRGKLSREISQDTPVEGETSNEESGTTEVEGDVSDVDFSVAANEEDEVQTSSGRTATPSPSPPPPPHIENTSSEETVVASTSEDPDANDSSSSDQSDEYTGYEDSNYWNSSTDEPVKPSRDVEDEEKADDVSPSQGVPKDDIEREPSFKVKLFNVGMEGRVPYSEKFL